MKSIRKYSSLSSLINAGVYASVVFFYSYPSAVKSESSFLSIFSEQKQEEPDWLRREAKAGKATAMTQLANQYFYGKNRKRNYLLAVYWYKRAIAAGDKTAKFNLAICYERGLGVKQDWKNCWRNFQSAICAGHRRWR